MIDSTRPFLVIYIVWHPDFTDGGKIAAKLRDHFRRKLFENVAGGTGISVVYRCVTAPSSNKPLPIDIEDAETAAIVLLADNSLLSSVPWREYTAALAQATDRAGLGTRLFPVAVEDGALERLGLTEQALRWHKWLGSLSDRCDQLVGHLTYEFCRMLRHYLEHLRRPDEDPAALSGYLKKVAIFLSHSKHDDDGQAIAMAIRKKLNDKHALASFFDVYDIPAGLKFHDVLLHQVRVSAMVAIHTDSYSSREWCRREIIEAKRHNVPLVVANSIADMDERGFPYMGNVPVVRLEKKRKNRIDVVIRKLLEENLKDFLWRCRVELVRDPADPTTIFLPRPPELISLAMLPPTEQVAKPVIVYPDPPLSAEEERLFSDVAPHVQLRSMTEWLAGAVR